MQLLTLWMGSLSSKHTVIIPPMSLTNVSSQCTLSTPIAGTMRFLTEDEVCASLTTITWEPKRKLSKGIDSTPNSFNRSQKDVAKCLLNHQSQSLQQGQCCYDIARIGLWSSNKWWPLAKKTLRTKKNKLESLAMWESRNKCFNSEYSLDITLQKRVWPCEPLSQGGRKVNDSQIKCCCCCSCSFLHYALPLLLVPLPPLELGLVVLTVGSWGICMCVTLCWKRRVVSSLGDIWGLSLWQKACCLKQVGRCWCSRGHGSWWDWRMWHIARQNRCVNRGGCIS